VTELVTGIDIVQMQIRVAANEKLPFTQRQIQMRGHAIECRVNAEDPVTFTPSPGRITTLNLPSGAGIRVDTAIYNGYFVPPHYDSLIAKVIVHSRSRERAIARMRRALESMVIEGIKTTIPLHLKILNDPDFIAGNISTRFMDRFLK
jgi:acetyl-CoA carboxylase, biotin carboxylase subunit